ncbi:protoheme IX farnesyltransferase [Aneurinibacillus soli]|uniref:Protoheme IX farnesyltransferase n=1 Tax=Aneurinibacillus soli TaxID=1500254 RepID=A0A0U5AS90_9BACL|nr:heme o synthase [Aneurinibacillus soli]PYE59333.1 protoheme IX farnesyltransferase [Aneurinibacillus soli]BAU26677.1 Protoheme IX farnesyltransferase 2 [Aneurinibacillus soli]
MGTPISEIKSAEYENTTGAVQGEPMTLKETIREYVGVTKVGITISNLMTLFAGLWLAADGPLPLSITLLTALGSSFIIMSGTSLNNYLDRDLDRHMERTKSRALVEGRLKPQNVMRLGLILGVLGSLMLLSVNALCAVLGLVALFFYVVVYTMWTKRTTTLNTLVGAVSGAMPPVMGYTAISGTLDLTAWILFFFMFIWQCPHFLALAMRRANDYRSAGFQMMPAVYGFRVTKNHILSYTIALVPISLMLYMVGEVGKVYLVAMSILGFGYLLLNFSGLFAKDDIKFGRRSFTYSIIYLTLFCLFVMIDRV